MIILKIDSDSNPSKNTNIVSRMWTESCSNSPFSHGPKYITEIKPCFLIHCCLCWISFLIPSFYPWYLFSYKSRHFMINEIDSFMSLPQLFPGADACPLVKIASWMILSPFSWASCNIPSKIQSLPSYQDLDSSA